MDSPLIAVADDALPAPLRVLLDPAAPLPPDVRLFAASEPGGALPVLTVALVVVPGAVLGGVLALLPLIWLRNGTLEAGGTWVGALVLETLGLGLLYAASRRLARGFRERRARARGAWRFGVFLTKSGLLLRHPASATWLPRAAITHFEQVTKGFGARTWHEMLAHYRAAGEAAAVALGPVAGYAAAPEPLGGRFIRERLELWRVTGE